MTDTDRMSEIEARVAKALDAPVSVHTSITLAKGEKDGTCIMHFKDWLDNWREDVPYILKQLEQAKPYQEFVKYALHTNRVATGTPCGIADCVFDSDDGCWLACETVAACWEAWQERKGK